ncbi:DUF2637 domain-containing protein [Mycobacterium kansasii]
MNTPTPEALRHRRSARHWARSGLVGFTAASSAANVTVIMAVPGATPMRVAIAALAPVVLAVMSHLLTKVMQGELTVSGIPSGWYWSTAVAVAAIGAGAFWLSFDTLRRAAEPDHGGSAWVFPATLDLAIVVCTVALVVIARADEHDQRTPMLREASAPEIPTEAPVAAPLREASVGELATQTAPVREAHTAVEPVEVPALREAEPSEPAADIATQESTLRDADTVEIPLTSGASREAAPVLRDVEVSKRRLAAVPPAVSDATQTDPVRDVDTEESAKQDDPVREADPGDDYLLRAQQLVDAGRTTSEVVDVVRVLRRKAAGMSNRDVAAEVGISEAKVQRIAKADRELATASA